MKSGSERFILDSNILIYLADMSDVAKHNKAVQLLSENPNTTFAVSTQNIREFARICLCKGILGPPEVCEFIDDFAARFSVFQDDFADTKAAAVICKGNAGLFWDANIVSVMKRKGFETILTENTKDFVTLGVKALNPLK